MDCLRATKSRQAYQAELQTPQLQSIDNAAGQTLFCEETAKVDSENARTFVGLGQVQNNNRRLQLRSKIKLFSFSVYRGYFMVGECGRFFFTSCERRERTSERSERVSSATPRNE